MIAQRVLIGVSCLVAVMAAAGCGAITGSPLISNDEARQQGELPPRDEPPAAIQKDASAVDTNFVADIEFGHEYIMPTHTYRYSGNVSDMQDPGVPNRTLLLNSALAGPPALSRAYYVIGHLPKTAAGAQEFLDKLRLTGSANNLHIGVWYRTADELFWGIHSLHYDWLPLANFGQAMDFQLGMLPHHNASTYVVNGVRYVVVVVEAQPIASARLQGVDLWTK